MRPPALANPLRQCKKSFAVVRVKPITAHKPFVTVAHGDESLHTRPAPRNVAVKQDVPVSQVYARLHWLAARGKVKECRQLAEHLVESRREAPNVQLYTALILSNVSHDGGGAWRAEEYLEEMKAEGLQPDLACCHALLKVLAVHPDHLLRADVLEYMQTKWYELSEDGAHDVVAGLLREGLFEQALDRLDSMQREGRVHPWLLDMAVFILCAAGETEAAHEIMQKRHRAGEQLSRVLWLTFLDAGSSQRHHPSTVLTWNSQVGTGYLNPPSGTCLDVLTTASQAGDAVLATDVFTHLSKRGVVFGAFHYQLLIECYLRASPPDLKRAMTILSIMTEHVMPTSDDTRALFVYLRSDAQLIAQAFQILRHLYEQNRPVPVSALNLIIECYVDQGSFTEALKTYKLIHTFSVTPNATTFNLLLRGYCEPPDEEMATFLFQEMLALNIKPTALTYDRLIQVCLEASVRALDGEDRQGGVNLLSRALGHFATMRDTEGWLPRFGTVERLATVLAETKDERCWEVLEAGQQAGQAGAAEGESVQKSVAQSWGRR